MRWFIFLLLCLTSCGPVLAQEEAPVHKELRGVKDQCVAALNKGDLDALTALADEEIVFTAMDSRLAHGKKELRAYFDEMLHGKDKVVDKYTLEVNVDRLTTMHGSDTGVATGTSVGHYKLTDGREFEITNRWSGTLVRKNGKWLVASFHSSANVFDNPILGEVKHKSTLMAVAAGVLALVIGLVVGRLTKKA
jgi:uncharacterized protein (TIGR02246 family)